MRRRRSTAPPAPEIELDEASIAEALEMLGVLATALFPNGEPEASLLGWDEPSGAFDAPPDVRTLQERLVAAESRFLTLVQQIPAVTFMAVLGEGENDIYVSPHIEQMLGYSQEEWLEDPFLWYSRLHPDDRPRWNEEFTRGIRTGGPFRAECRFVARDGRNVWVHGEARVVKDEKGRPQFLQGVAFDITESKRAQELLLASAVREAESAEQLAIARRIHGSLLPREPSLPGLAIAASTTPADDVGGDYFDVRPTDDGGWLFAGDVSGHGLDAGLVMMMLQSAAHAIASTRPAITPRDLLASLNEVLFDMVHDRLRRDDYVTLTAIRYTRDGRLVFAGAHQDILVLRATTGRVERVPTEGPWIGIRRDVAELLTEATITLEPGDTFVLFTDGIIDAPNDADERFDVSRLCTAIEEARDLDPEGIRRSVLFALASWTPYPEDDATLLVARYAPR